MRLPVSACSTPASTAVIPLLRQALDSSDLHTVEPSWGSNDEHGHGTQMAGLAFAGDLTPLLDASGPEIIDPTRREV